MFPFPDIQWHKLLGMWPGAPVFCPRCRWFLLEQSNSNCHLFSAADEWRGCIPGVPWGDTVLLPPVGPGTRCLSACWKLAFLHYLPISALVPCLLWTEFKLSASLPAYFSLKPSLALLIAVCTQSAFCLWPVWIKCRHSRVNATVLSWTPGGLPL